MSRELERWRLIASYYGRMIPDVWDAENKAWDFCTLDIRLATEMADEMMALYPSEEEPKEMTARELVERMETFVNKLPHDDDGIYDLMFFARKEAGIDE